MPTKHGRALKALNIVTLLLALLVFKPLTIEVSSKNVRLAQFSTLTSNGVSLNYPDVLSSCMIVPLAVRHFNERNASVLPIFGNLGNCNAKILIIDGIRDDQGLASVAVKDFVGNARYKNVDVIQGAIRSAVSQPLAVTAGALQIPQISHAATSETLSNPKLYPMFFRTVPSDAQRAAGVAQLFKGWGYRKVGMIYINDVFGNSWKNSFFQECESRKISLVSATYTSGVTGKELDNQVRKGLSVLIQERISVIVHVSVDANFMYSLAKAARDLNWLEGKLYVGHSNYFDSTNAIQTDVATVSKFLHGSLLIFPFIEENDGWRNLRDIWPTLNVSYFNDLFYPGSANATAPTFQLPSDFFALGYEKQLYRSWAFAYDSIAAIGLAACNQRSPSLYVSLQNVDFQGTSGRVRFDNTTMNRSPNTLYFALFNTVVRDGNIITTQVGKRDPAGNWTFIAPITFSDGRSVPPEDVEPPISVIEVVPLAARIWGWIEASLAVLAGCIALVYVHMHSEDRVIVESQPLFMELLALGCIILGVAIIPLTIENDVGCMMFPWLFAIGFTLVLASLSSKSARVAILWYRKGPIKERNRSVRATVLLWGITMCLLVAVALLTAWQVVAPLRYVLVVSQRDSDENPLYSSAVCVSESSQSTILFVVLMVYICLVVLATMWVSFWVRNAPEKYHETKMTAVAGMCIFQVFFVGLPAAAAVWERALPRFLVLSSITFLLCLIILGTLFVPKVFKSRFISMQTIANQEGNQTMIDNTENSNVRAFRPSTKYNTVGRFTVVVRRGAVPSDVRAVRSGHDGESEARSSGGKQDSTVENVKNNSREDHPHPHGNPRVAFAEDYDDAKSIAENVTKSASPSISESELGPLSEGAKPSLTEMNDESRDNIVTKTSLVIT